MKETTWIAFIYWFGKGTTHCCCLWYF